MVVSEGTPVPPAQVAADASGSQRPRSRFAAQPARRDGRWDLDRLATFGPRDSYDVNTVRAAPTAACAEHGMRLLGVPDQPGEPTRTAVSRLGEKRVTAEEVAAVQVDATGPAQFPRGRSRSPMPPMGMKLPLGFVAGNSIHVAVRRSVRRRTGA